MSNKIFDEKISYMDKFINTHSKRSDFPSFTYLDAKFHPTLRDHLIILSQNNMPEDLKITQGFQASAFGYSSAINDLPEKNKNVDKLEKSYDPDLLGDSPFDYAVKLVQNKYKKEKKKNTRKKSTGDSEKLNEETTDLDVKIKRKATIGDKKTHREQFMKKDDSSEDYEGGESDEEEAKSKKQSRPSSAISNDKKQLSEKKSERAQISQKSERKKISKKGSKANTNKSEIMKNESEEELAHKENESVKNSQRSSKEVSINGSKTKSVEQNRENFNEEEKAEMSKIVSENSSQVDTQRDLVENTYIDEMGSEKGKKADPLIDNELKEKKILQKKTTKGSISDGHSHNDEEEKGSKKSEEEKTLKKLEDEVSLKQKVVDEEEEEPKEKGPLDIDINQPTATLENAKENEKPVVTSAEIYDTLTEEQKQEVINITFEILLENKTVDSYVYHGLHPKLQAPGFNIDPNFKLSQENFTYNKENYNDFYFKMQYK